MYKMQTKKTSVICGIILLCGSVNGHGRLLDPPQRSSLWRFYKDIGASINYNDHELFCGGFKVQSNNDGKCGTCGDPYDGERENEAGGKYALGFISRTYQEGRAITVTVQMTAAHKGYFEFKICPHNDVHTPVSQECLDMYPLAIAGQTVNPYRYTIDSKSGYYYIELQLPDGVTCSQCVLQWYYKAGNSYGCDPDGTCCIGCGPQETFINCADVSIVDKDVPVTTPAQMTTASPTKSYCDLDYIPDCKAVGAYPSSDLWCTKMCRGGNTECTPDRCNCTCVKQIMCVPVGSYDAMPGMIDWCNSNCAYDTCDSSVCDCK